jgi:hypothetical protein
VAFSVYEPGPFGFANALAEGEVSVYRNGTTLFNKADLGLVGITDAAVVLVDEATMRVALRKPRSGEANKVLKVSPPRRRRGSGDSNRRQVYLGGPIRAMNIEPETVAGRYEATTVDDLFIVNLGGLEKGTAKSSKPKR